MKLLLIFLFTFTVWAQTPTVSWAHNPTEHGSEVVISATTADKTVNCFLVTVAWEAAYDAETVLRVVPLGKTAKVFIPVEKTDCRITRIQVIPATLKDRNIMLLLPGVGGLPK